MTKEEHLLVVTMFTQQALAIQALVRILRSHGLIVGDDFRAYHELAQDEEIRSQGTPTFARIAQQYQMLAKNYGLTLDLSRP